MWDFLFSSLWGVLGITGAIVAVCAVVAYIFPPLRRTAIEIGLVVLGAASIYAKGSRDRAALEQKRKDEAVATNQRKFNEIDARPDTPDSAAGRLRDGSF